MPKAFALMTAAAMASLALPGMSGFVSELQIFLGITTSDVYSANFKTMMIAIAAFGVIITPIYLLSTLRQVFYGKPNPELHLESVNPYFSDANPREVFIAACLIVPIVAIGLYPKLATQTYDVKTVAVTEQARDAFSTVAQSNPNLYAAGWVAPKLPNSPSPTLLGIVE